MTNHLADSVRRSHEIGLPTAGRVLKQRTEHVTAVQAVFAGVGCASPAVGDSEVMIADVGSGIIARVGRSRRTDSRVVRRAEAGARIAAITRWPDRTVLACAVPLQVRRPVSCLLQELEVS